MLSLVSGVIFSYFSVHLCSYLFDLPFQKVKLAISSLSSVQDITISKIVLLLNSIGIFTIPSLIFAYLFSKSPIQFLRLQRFEKIQNLSFLLVLYFALIPILNLTVHLNESVHLPEFVSHIEEWMRTKENNAGRLTDSFLIMSNPLDLVINILLIAVVPAIGEELLFRGVIQRTLIGKRINHHLAIWITATIFSAIHFQFFGFLPRMILGAIFGYLYHWSSNLWVPIVAHFINNAMAVCMTYLFSKNGIEEQIEAAGTNENTWYLSLFSVLLFTAGMYYVRKLPWVNVTSRVSST